MDEKWDKIVTITFWICFIGPFMILLPHKWLNAFLYLDPYYEMYEAPAIDWAIATFATLGVLLALVVPKIIDFDRDIIKQMGLPTFTGTHPRSFLYCLKQTNSTKLKKQYEFILNVNVFYGVLCFSLFAFIFMPSFRGIWAVFVFMYSGLLLHSIQFMTQEEELEVLLLKNIQEKDVNALLDEYVKKVYSTQGHPRQEIFYRLFTEKHDKGNEYHTLLSLIHQKLIDNKVQVSPSLLRWMLMINIPSYVKHICDSPFSRSELRENVERFQEVLEIIEHNPVGVHWTQEKLLSRAYCGECILNSQDLKDASILYGFSDSSDTDSNRLNELIRQDFLNIFPCKERRWVSETNDVSQNPEFCFIDDDHCMFRTHLIKMDYLNAYLRFLRYTQNKEALKSFAENFATEYKNGYRSRDVTWVTSIDYEELFCLVCITLGSYYRTRDSDSFLQKKATDIHYKYDGATLIILGIVHACQETELESWLKEGHLLHYCLKNIPALKELLIVSPKIGTYFESEIKKTLELPLIQEAFSLNDEDTKSILNKWEAFHTKLKSLYEEEG
jgi:hypothetical protein